MKTDRNTSKSWSLKETTVEKLFKIFSLRKFCFVEKWRIENYLTPGISKFLLIKYVTFKTLSELNEKKENLQKGAILIYLTFLEVEVK